MDLQALLIRHLVFPAWVRRNRSARLVYLREFEQTQFWSRERIEALQLSQLQNLVSHAYQHCAFYRKKLLDAGIAPRDIRSLSDVTSLPTTTKREIQESWPELIADDTRQDELVRDMTGGSTGSPLVFFYDRDRLDSRVGATFRHDRWAGWDIGEKLALLWGAPRDTTPSRRWDRWRGDILGRRLMLDASALDDARMRDFAERLRRFRPKVIQAYANTLALFAGFVKKQGLDDIRPTGVICSAELLTEENRALIGEVFRCPVLNRYGSREFSVIASECGHSRGMHLNAENLLVEVMPDPALSVDGAGEFVITDLKNRAMPLIRYRTMDVGRLLAGECSCGRGLPLMEIVGGRTTDFLTATNDTKVSGVVIATYVITNNPGIRQVQFVQRCRGKVTVSLVRGQDWNERTSERLSADLRHYLGQDIAIDQMFVREIPRDNAGKYRFSISTV